MRVEKEVYLTSTEILGILKGMKLQLNKRLIMDKDWIKGCNYFWDLNEYEFLQ
jgi:hypothetical protein